jgi:hypothetical protein
MFIVSSLSPYHIEGLRWKQKFRLGNERNYVIGNFVFVSRLTAQFQDLPAVCYLWVSGVAHKK